MKGRPSVMLTPRSKSSVFKRDQRLVVIHADRDVVAPARRGMEHRVGRHRAGDVDAGFAQRFDRGRDDLDILAADRAVLAGMRVEAGDREARPGDAEIALQARGGDLCRR